MTKQEALYFLEGLEAGIAAPSAALAKALFVVLALKYVITPAEIDPVRDEIDHYLEDLDE